MNHAHGNREYRSQVHPIYKKQNPHYGENHPNLIKYKGKNKYKLNPYWDVITSGFWVRFFVQIAANLLVSATLWVTIFIILHSFEKSPYLAKNEDFTWQKSAVAYPPKGRV